MEHWQFLSVQIWTHDIGNFITSLFQFLVFFVALFSMDRTENTWDFILSFGFECEVGTTSRWYIETSPKASTLWELHIIIVFMYTTLAIIVLSTIPYKYDRLFITEKEKRGREAKDAKKLAKLAKKRTSKREMVDNLASPDYNLFSEDLLA